MLCDRSQGFLIIGSGMAVHSFASIEEIHQAADPEEKEIRRAKVLNETITFDARLQTALKIQNAVERRKALLDLEALHEFKRSHPTVEVGPGLFGLRTNVSVVALYQAMKLTYLNI